MPTLGTSTARRCRCAAACANLLQPRAWSQQTRGVGRGMLQLLEGVHESAKPFGDIATTSEAACDALMQYNSHALGLELVEQLSFPSRRFTRTHSPNTRFSAAHATARARVALLLSGAHPRPTGAAGKCAYPRLSHGLPLRHYLRCAFDSTSRGINRQNPTVQYIKNLIALRKQIKTDLYVSDFGTTSAEALRRTKSTQNCFGVGRQKHDGNACRPPRGQQGVISACD